MIKTLLTGALTSLAVVSLAAETTTWKQGLKGYRGTQDTYLVKLAKDKSMNGKAVLSLTSAEPANPREDRVMIRFTALNLPPKAKITKATLRLYAFDLKPGKPAPVDPVLNVSPVSADWNEKEATWNEAVKGKAWNRPGGDFGPVETSVTVPLKDFKPGWLEFDVTKSLQTMLTEGKNYGWLIRSEAARGNNNATILFRDWEFPKETDPELVVTWELALPE